MAVPAIMAMLGVLLDRYGFRLLQDRDPLSVVLVTFGLLLIIEDFVQTVWGKSNLSVPAPAALSTSIDLFGTPVPAYRLAVIAVGAGLAGVVSAPFLSLSPSMSSDVIIDSFVVVVVGGLGSLSGAFIAAMGLGMVQALGAVYLPNAAVLLPFMLMVGILIWKPSGFAGSRT